MWRLASPGLAPLSAVFNVVQTAVLAANKLTLVVPLFLLNGTGTSASFSAEQLQALSYLAIKAHGHGFGIGLIFFGFACLVRGYLIYRSGYLPKLLGLLLVLAGLGYLVNSFALILAPALAAQLSPAVLVPAFVGELALSLWLIVKGVDRAQWGRHGAPQRSADQAA